MRLEFAPVNFFVFCITDPCSSRVCLNNGKCIVNNNGTTQCECVAGFKGSFCEKGRVQCHLNVDKVRPGNET